ncbi:MAG: hypothetical protein A2X25_11305 [Chloroflexi bacterium GWB2_49_20]|nr:MAG: hypothetical protein A2X25_11305 [Chloroflexi bacterium GWB2_49_20]OGN78864.1 MAG: hypothetical protein A2X26_00045 [Chloroflexi bacterium GWC2_49_37]OGN86376.1 MAG: hypothetical protein A2X27_05730 [Chloroflexi bacterium GWD2_49_16]
MGVAGLPQSATGQATLLTGVNFAKRLGYHFGPKPNPEIKMYFQPRNASNTQISAGLDDIQSNTSIFSQLFHAGKTASFLNAYPSVYFQKINSGKRNHSVIPLAATSSGINLFNQNDLIMDRALSADFTGQGWHDHLNISDTPILDPVQAGIRLAALSKNYHFSMFEFWESDFIGHKQNFSNAIRLIEKIDLVLKGLLSNWDMEDGGILITSDHGNLEDLTTRKHTKNCVPAIFIGAPAYQQKFSQRVRSIVDIAPFIIELLSD